MNRLVRNMAWGLLATGSALVGFVCLSFFLMSRVMGWESGGRDYWPGLAPSLFAFLICLGLFSLALRFLFGRKVGWVVLAGEAVLVGLYCLLQLPTWEFPVRLFDWPGPWPWLLLLLACLAVLSHAVWALRRHGT